MDFIKINIGTDVTDLRHVDGTKCYLDGEDRWLMVRPDGTEPVLRVHARGADEEGNRRVLNTGRTEMNV